MFIPPPHGPKAAQGGVSAVLTRQHPHRESGGSGYNPRLWSYSNMATEQSSLFPDCQPVVEGIQARMMEPPARVEVLIYGDGCFKDPVGASGNLPIQ